MLTFLPKITSPNPGPWKWKGTPVPAPARDKGQQLHFSYRNKML